MSIPHLHPESDLGPFVGRTGELRALQGVFEQGRGLVTISGMGGTGKTRLALEFARTQPRPTWFVDLGGVQSPEGAVAAMADALRGAHRVADAEDLLRVLAELGPALVVLDAFEHLVDHSPATVAAWRRAAPQVQLLVTSRLPLGLTSEQVIVLAPMTPEDALALLATRAKLADYGFDADANHDTLVDVTARLEGIPLAIELAAARLQTLSAQQLLRRLEDRLAVLRTGKRNVVPRHAAMEATLDWSWALLTDAEQRALAQCTVFRSDFPVEAAEAVIRLPDDGSDVLDLVQSLHGQGWVRTVGRGSARQLALLDVVREYASQHLPQADELAAQARHTAFYLHRTAHLVSSSALAEVLLDGVDDTGVADVDHMEAITRRPDISAEERTDAALAGFVLLLRQGPAPRVHQLLSEAQGRLPDDAPLSAARLALAAHHAKRFFGTPLKGFLTLADAVQAARAAPDQPLAAQLLHYQGRELRLAGHAREGAALYDQALALAHTSGDQPTIALCLQGPAITAIRVEPAPKAQAVAERMVRTATELGYRRMRCVWLDNHGVQLFEAGQIREAWARASEAVALERATDNVALMGITLVNMSEYAAADDRFDDARGCLAEAAELFAVTAAESLPMSSWGRASALLALAEGRLDEEHAASTGRQLQPDLAVGLDHQVRAMLCLLRGQPAEAVAELHTTERLGAAVSRETFTDLALWLGFRALGEALLGQAEQARATFDAASTEAERWGYARVEATLGVLRAAVDLACEGSGAQQRAEQVLRDAHARTPPFVPYLETRIACRMLAQGLGAAGPTLTVGPELAWVRTDEGARLALHRSPLPRRLLTALLTAHREERGRSVPTPTLLQAGWPGDRSRQEALENRLWVALSKLRRNGLQHVLERVEGGYRIAPSVRIVDHAVPRPADPT